MNLPASMEEFVALAAREIEAADRWLNTDADWSVEFRTSNALVCTTRAQVFATLAQAAATLEVGLGAVAAATASELLADHARLEELPAADKARIMEAMGFERLGEVWLRSRKDSLPVPC